MVNGESHSYLFIINQWSKLTYSVVIPLLVCVMKHYMCCEFDKENTIRRLMSIRLNVCYSNF